LLSQIILRLGVKLDGKTKFHLHRKKIPIKPASEFKQLGPNIENWSPTPSSPRGRVIKPNFKHPSSYRKNFRYSVQSTVFLPRQNSVPISVPSQPSLWDSFLSNSRPSSSHLQFSTKRLNLPQIPSVPSNPTSMTILTSLATPISPRGPRSLPPQTPTPKEGIRVNVVPISKSISLLTAKLSAKANSIVYVGQFEPMLSPRSEEPETGNSSYAGPPQRRNTTGIDRRSFKMDKLTKKREKPDKVEEEKASSFIYSTLNSVNLTSSNNNNNTNNNTNGSTEKRKIIRKQPSGNFLNKKLFNSTGSTVSGSSGQGDEG